MTVILSVVCVECHAGWTNPPGPDNCPVCDRVGVVRGVYRSLPMTRRPSLCACGAPLYLGRKRCSVKCPAGAVNA